MADLILFNTVNGVVAIRPSQVESLESLMDGTRNFCRIALLSGKEHDVTHGASDVAVDLGLHLWGRDRPSPDPIPEDG